MSLTPGTPNMSPKSFWERPEGKTGLVTLLIMGGATALVVWWFVLPYLLAMAWGTLELAVVGSIAAGLIYVLFDKGFRNLLKNVFQLSMRWTTGLVIELDPIGILKNNLDRMRDEKNNLDEAVSKLNGSKTSAERSISAKTKDIEKLRSEIKFIEEQQTKAPKNDARQMTWTIQRQSKLTEAGLKMESVKRIKTLLDQATKMYQLGLRWRDLADFQINTTAQQVEVLAEERKQILNMTAGMSSMKRMLKGDPEQLKMVNQTLEYLAEDSATKLGDIQDFARFSEKYLNNMDVEQGAGAEDAEKMFAEFEQKLLPSGTTQTIPSDMPVVDGEYVPAKPRSMEVGSSTFDDLLK